MPRAWLSGGIALSAALALTACAINSQVPLVPAVRAQTTASASLTVRFIVASRTAAKGAIENRRARAGYARRPQFISADTRGVSIAMTGPTTQTVVVNIAPGAAACAGSTASPRTCSSTIVAAVGAYTVAATTYDAAPVAGAIPGTAHILAQGTVTGVSIVNGQANLTTVYVGGVVANFGTAMSYISLSGNSVAQQVGFALAPTDYDNEAITAGTSINDPYANPITLTLTESNGSGHESLVKNGVNVGLTATLTKSNDSVQIAYDGGGSAGYSGTIAITATGVTTVNVIVSPMYVAPGGNYGLAGQVNFTGTGETSPLAITEQSAPGTVAYTALSNAACTGVFTASAVSGSGASASLTLTAGATVSKTGCVETISDNLGTSTSVAISVTLRGITLHAITGVPLIICVGSDGNLWFSEHTATKIGKMNPSTYATSLYSIGLTGAPKGIVNGPDNNLWFTEDANNAIGTINPTTHAITEYFTGITNGAQPNAIAPGSDGNLWFSETGGHHIASINPTTHLVSEYPTTNSTSQVVSGPDNNIWFTENVGNLIGTINVTTHVVSEFSAGLTASSGPKGLATGPDGNLWFTESLVDQIGSINPTTHVISEYTGLASGASPVFITSGPDGNMWFAEYAGSRIGVINVSTHVVNEYTVPSGKPNAIVGLGANLWFADNGATNIGEVTP